MGCKRYNDDCMLCDYHETLWAESMECKRFALMQEESEYPTVARMDAAKADFMRRIEAEERNTNPEVQTQKEAPKPKEQGGLSDETVWGIVKP